MLLTLLWHKNSLCECLVQGVSIPTHSVRISPTRGTCPVALSSQKCQRGRNISDCLPTYEGGKQNTSQFSKQTSFSKLTLLTFCEKLQPWRVQLEQWESFQAAGHLTAHSLLLRGVTCEGQGASRGLCCLEQWLGKAAEVSSNSRAFVRDAAYKLLPTGKTCGKQELPPVAPRGYPTAQLLSSAPLNICIHSLTEFFEFRIILVTIFFLSF